MFDIFDKFIQLRERGIHSSLQNMTNGIDCPKNQWLISLENEDCDYSEAYSPSIECAFEMAVDMWNKQYPTQRLTFDTI